MTEGSTDAAATVPAEDQTTAGADQPSAANGSTVAQLVGAWTPAIDNADGFAGTLTQNILGVQTSTTFQAANDGGDQTERHVGSVDVAQQSPDGDELYDWNVRRVGPEGIVLVGPARSVRMIVGAELAGAKNWVALTDVRPARTYRDVADQTIDSIDPYRYLALLSTADSVSVEGSSTATFTLPQDGYRRAFPHAFAGVPNSPDEATATVEFDSQTHTFTTITIDLVRTNGDLPGTWTFVYQLDSFDEPAIDMPPASDVAQPVDCDSPSYSGPPILPCD